MSPATRHSSASNLTPIGCLLLCWPVGVAAHLKWFADYGLLKPPRQLLQIVSGEYFLAFCLFVAPIVFAVTVIDHRMVVRRYPLYRHSIQRAGRVQPSVPMVLRLATCIFFLTAATAGAISDQVFILTPELETRHALVAVIQLGYRPARTEISHGLPVRSRYCRPLRHCGH